MRRYLMRNLLMLGLILLLIVVSLGVALSHLGSADYGVSIPLRNQASPHTQKAQLLKPTDGQQRLTLSIGLQPHALSQLVDMASAVYNPRSPFYHQFLTPDQFEQRFAPTSDQVQQVEDFLQQQGLTDIRVDPNNLLLHVSGTVAQMQHIFHVHLNDYKQGSQLFYANTTAPSIPAHLLPLISSVNGLDDIVSFHPHYQHGAKASKNLHDIISGYGPQDLAGGYDFTALHNAGIWGDNQTIALLELDGYQASDIAQYAQHYNIGTTASQSPSPTSTPTVSPTATPTSTPTATNTPTSTPIATPASTNATGGTATSTPIVSATQTSVPTGTSGNIPTQTASPTPTASGQNNAGGMPPITDIGSGTTKIAVGNILLDNTTGSAGMNALEDELDMEVVAAVAPHATQLIYEGPNTQQGMSDLVNRTVTDNTAKIVSISWGKCEAQAALPGSANMKTLDTMFLQGSAQGMSFFAASGDTGAYDCGDNNLQVDYPASDPYVTGVGGTNLQLQSGAYGSETVWANPNDALSSQNGAGSGGGLSQYYQQPVWQSGPGVQNSYSTGKREVPDVAADADTATGYAVYCTVQNACSSSGWQSVGGTSGAAPLWAATAALINQYMISQGEAPIGLANPTLYGLFNAHQSFPAFHSITGNNLYYPATPGYNMATGLGSPDVYNIARDLAGNQ